MLSNARRSLHCYPWRWCLNIRRGFWKGHAAAKLAWGNLKGDLSIFIDDFGFLGSPETVISSLTTPQEIVKNILKFAMKAIDIPFWGKQFLTPVVFALDLYPWPSGCRFFGGLASTGASRTSGWGMACPDWSGDVGFFFTACCCSMTQALGVDFLWSKAVSGW